MVSKKESKEATATKDAKVKRGMRFLSVFFAGDGSLIFRNYPSRQEVSVKADSSTDDLGKLVKKAHTEAKGQSK
jgi:hypothetical protein